MAFHRKGRDSDFKLLPSALYCLLSCTFVPTQLPHLLPVTLPTPSMLLYRKLKTLNATFLHSNCQFGPIDCSIHSPSSYLHSLFLHKLSQYLSHYVHRQFTIYLTDFPHTLPMEFKLSWRVQCFHRSSLGTERYHFHNRYQQQYRYHTFSLHRNRLSIQIPDLSARWKYIYLPFRWLCLNIYFRHPISYMETYNKLAINYWILDKNGNKSPRNSIYIYIYISSVCVYPYYLKLI